MMRASVSVDKVGFQRYKANLGKLDLAVGKTAADTDAFAKDSIKRRMSQGEAYERGGRTHYASRPGYPPNTDTGRLANSIKHRKIASAIWEVRADAIYALALEIGTRRVAARPFLVPALRNQVPPFRKAIEAIMRGPV